MIIWSPSSWDLWKKCPTKYRIKKLERWQHPDLKEDTTYAKLAIPGLTVDRILQFWIYRNRFNDKTWLEDNFEMFWQMVLNEIKPKWSELESIAIREETILGLKTAIHMLEGIELQKYSLLVQPSFFEKITDEFSIAGSADLLLIEPDSNNAILIDFKNSHSRERLTKDQLLFYQIGLKKSVPYNFIRSGYLMFNPRLEEWKWFNLTNEVHEQRLIAKLTEATVKVNQAEFDCRWNHFSCARYCEVRFGCPMFQKLLGRNRFREFEKVSKNEVLPENSDVEIPRNN
jgi:hypothetical protein